MIGYDPYPITRDATTLIILIFQKIIMDINVFRSEISMFMNDISISHIDRDPKPVRLPD